MPLDDCNGGDERRQKRDSAEVELTMNGGGRGHVEASGEETTNVVGEYERTRND